MLKQIILCFTFLGALAFAKPHTISYYFNHTPMKLPSTHIASIFDLAKFNDATIKRGRSHNKTTQTTSMGSTLIDLTIANLTTQKLAVYVQPSDTLSSTPPNAFCTVPANSNDTVYAQCSQVLQAVTGETYAVYVVAFSPDSGVDQVKKELSNNALFTQDSVCRLSSNLGSGATLLSNKAVQLPASGAYLFKVLAANQCSVI